MTRFATVLGFAVLSAVVGASEPGPPPDPRRPHDVWDVNGTEGVERVTQFLKLSRMSGDERNLVDQIMKAYRNNPGSNLQDVANRVLKENPNLDAAKMEQLLDVLNRQTGSRPMPNPRTFFPEMPPPRGERPPPPIPNDPPLPPIEPFTPTKGTNPDVPGGFDPSHKHGRPWGKDHPPRHHGPRGEDDPNFRETRINPWHEEFDDDPLRKDKKLSKFLAMWEKNFGPIAESPAFRSLLLELMTGANGDPGSGPASGLLDMLNDPNTDGQDISEWLDAQGEQPSGWNLPDLGLKDWNFGGFDKTDTPDLGGSLPKTDASWFNRSGYSGTGGSADSWISVILFVVVAAGALVAWRYWPYLSGKLGVGKPRPIPGLGPWPVDPRSISDREALVRAFEYLSVLVCGTGAKVWNHVTIATALGRAVGTVGEEAAEPLARLYAVARYTPAEEPLPAEAFAEARLHLSRLAGVAAP